MKTSALIVAAFIALSFGSCSLIDSLTNKDSIDGEQSDMGQVGAEVSSSDIPGVTNARATVTTLDGGISKFTGEATITDPALLNIVSNIPEFTVIGNTVSVSDLEVKVTKEGIESKIPSFPGIIVKYDSKVGDKYKVANGVERKVISKSDVDEYPYGYYLIKVMKVEESPSIIPGVTKMVYIANHKFGIVGLEVTFSDGTTTTFTIWGSTQN
jgi:hypothetical protein